MLTPLHTDATTTVLGAPPDWDTRRGPCIGLPIVDHDGILFSYWTVPWRDRLRVLMGRPIRLSVAASAHPAVGLDTAT